LAAVLLFGYGVWPGIFLGAFAVNPTTAGSILSSLGIATGNTLEALAGAYLVVRFVNGRKVFERAENIFKLLLFTCILATTIGARVGNASVFLTASERLLRIATVHRDFVFDLRAVGFIKAILVCVSQPNRLTPPSILAINAR
jgi:integral membrane sensor domain MASE1